MIVRALGTIAFVSCVVACGGASPPPAEPMPTPAGATAAGAQSCNADADCELVELGCCDHCNGGKVDAFNKASAASKKPTCGATACTKRGCEPATAACVAHRCVANTP